MKQNYSLPHINSGSMADIAFLLLTFFLMTTVIGNDQGIALLLPAYTKTNPLPIHERNLFRVHINAHNQFMVEGEPRKNLMGLKEEVKKFVLNNGLDPNSSDSPEKAVVSVMADRDTNHAAFIHVLDQIQAAYYEIYAEQAGISPGQFRKLDLNNKHENTLYKKGKQGVPMNISITGFSATK